MTHAVPNESIEADSKKNKNPRNRWLIILATFFLLIGVIWFLYWLFIGRFYVYTENAYVNGNEVMLTPQITAGVKAIYTDDTNFVEKGQLLVELDTSNYEIAVEEKKKILANTVREVASLFQNVKAKEAEVTLREAEKKLAEFDFTHRKPLVKTGAVSVEEFETYETKVAVATAALTLAEKEMESANVLIEGTTIETHPRVLEATWKLRQAYLDLIRCKIWSPVTGYIGKRSVQVGDQVMEGDTLLYIVPLDYIWIDANYKETQLKNVRIGQKVNFTADLYGKNVEYQGYVIGFQPGSGNAFSILPPENASGNWIKILQRVPVRISVDPEEIRKHPLFLGLSMRVTVNVHDTSGLMLSQKARMTPLYTTEIYEKQMEDLAQFDPLINDIIESNQQKYSLVENSAYGS